MVFTVKRTGGLGPGSVDFETSIGSGDTTSAGDFTATKGTLTFAAGEATKTFTVQTTHDALVEGNETFTVTLSNATAAGKIPSPTVTGTIINNTDPTAAADAIAVNEDAVTANLAPVLLGNDSEPDPGDTIRILSVDTTGTIGTVSFDAVTQALTYTANHNDSLAAGAPGADHFTYTIIDGGNATSTATVTIAITGVNDAPTLSATAANPTFTEAAVSAHKRRRWRCSAAPKRALSRPGIRFRRWLSR